jgi:two-component system OmpR family response regulator
MSETGNQQTRVLVVDDNRDAATTLARLLKVAGFEAEACFDGWAALIAADRFRPHACVLDILMPDMDGYELARRFRERCGDHPPVLATATACDDEPHLDRAAAAGFDLHFSKPTDVGAMAEQLAACVREQTGH